MLFLSPFTFCSFIKDNVAHSHLSSIQLYKVISIFSESVRMNSNFFIGSVDKVQSVSSDLSPYIIFSP